MDSKEANAKHVIKSLVGTIFMGLQPGFTMKGQVPDNVYDELRQTLWKFATAHRCMISCTRSECFYPGSNELGAEVRIYNHPKYERKEHEFMALVSNLAYLLKGVFRQWRVESDCNGFLTLYGPIKDVKGEPVPEGHTPIMEIPKKP